MGKMELEIKILDINKEEFINKITKMGAVFKEENKQYLYTYDLSTIYGRFIDISFQLNNPESKIKYDTAIERLKLFAFEFDNLLQEDKQNEFEQITGYKNLSSICESSDLLEFINNINLIEFMKKFQNNSKKWIRVRQTNDKTTIAIKHILAKNNTKIQQMLETEIEISNIKEANDLLEALGFSHKSYQEKHRITYVFEGYEIDIDTWPGIPTYFEIEGNSKEDLEQILNKLGYSISDGISCTADEIYERYGKSMFDCREIKF